MREFNSCPNRLMVTIIYVIFLISSASAFPLYGGNGVVNATVYGVMKYEYGDGLYIDISASNSDTYSVELIDSNNNIYSGNKVPYRSSLRGYPTETAYNGYIRDIVLFNIQKDAVVKSLRVVPSSSKPFYINWTGAPEATSLNETLKFYGANFEENGLRWRQGNWNLDVNITNNANQTAEYNSTNFALVDQFGWVYLGGRGDALKEIPPGESLRFNVKIPYVSEISRPMMILFKGLRLDISGWA